MSVQISLAAARVNAKMTQEEVAQKMQVSRQTLINWESGKISPRIPELEMLSRMYGVPVDFIFLPKNSTKSRETRSSVTA